MIDDPEPPTPRGKRYFDPEQRPMDYVWVLLLPLVPKLLRTHQPFSRYFHQPEHLAWAKREAERMWQELGWDDDESE
jgi:hypothetical protein